LMVWSRSRFWTTNRERVRVSGILEFTTLDDEILGPFDGLFRRFRRLLAMDIRTQCHGGVHFGQCHGGVFSLVGSSRHGYTDKGKGGKRD